MPRSNPAGQGCGATNAYSVQSNATKGERVMAIMSKRHEERQRVRGQEVQERLRKLQGRKEAGLIADRDRGPASPLGKRKIEERKR